MAVKSVDEILTALKEHFGDDSSDKVLEIYEDITDSMKDTTDWKKKCEETEAQWREKYRQRFFSPDEEQPGSEHAPEHAKKLTFESLFKEE